MTSRYQSDPEYREQVKAKARAYYWENENYREAQKALMRSPERMAVKNATRRTPEGRAKGAAYTIKHHSGWTAEARRQALLDQNGVCAIGGCDQLATTADHIEYGGVKYQRAMLCNYHNSGLHHIDHYNPAMKAYVNLHRGRIFGGDDPLVAAFGF